MKKVLLAGIVTGVMLVGIINVANANLFTNGSFEDGTYVDNGGFQTLNAGSSAISGWIVSGSVDWIGSYWKASNGTRSLDMSGFMQQGAISQTFDTTVGQKYLVTFD